MLIWICCTVLLLLDILSCMLDDIPGLFNAIRSLTIVFSFFAFTGWHTKAHVTIDTVAAIAMNSSQTPRPRG
jgi:hypothetical protein